MDERGGRERERRIVGFQNVVSKMKSFGLLKSKGSGRGVDERGWTAKRSESWGKVDFLLSPFAKRSFERRVNCPSFWNDDVRCARGT